MGVKDFGVKVLKRLHKDIKNISKKDYKKLFKRASKINDISIVIKDRKKGYNPPPKNFKRPNKPTPAPPKKLYKD